MSTNDYERPRYMISIAADLVGKWTRLKIECVKCGRRSSYRVASLQPRKSPIEFKAELTRKWLRAL